ncbi:POK9 protein, partial [Campylorhamphus procurvoides]|nr:POK9 protein [Campylorhamphus procurvoides]
GSLGLDLAAAVTVTVTSTAPQKIPTTTFGPLHPQKVVGALLIGRSSSDLHGLCVLPGVIDADYCGQICVIAYPMQPPLIVQKGTRIAQLVLISRHPATPAPVDSDRYDQGFGSTGNYVVNLVQQLTCRPQLTVIARQHAQTQRFNMLCDTGADVTILS